ncbi:MAG TPA: hypothetical protein VKR32_18045, partial [Puia sp.]|nr:hypothetical protein [Puia sp.]
QVRDYLPIDVAADYIVRIAVQHDVLGVINCCSAAPVTIEKFVRDYIRKKNAETSLNLGYFPYPDYEPMSFWGDNHKLKKVLDGEKQSNC